MNIFQSKKIACVITHEQLNQMFENAKKAEIEWRSCSVLNPTMTKGAVWNVLYPAFLNGPNRHASVGNMVREFGEFLPEEIKPKKKPAPEKINPYHEEPIFEVEPCTTG